MNADVSSSEPGECLNRDFGDPDLKAIRFTVRIKPSQPDYSQALTVTDKAKLLETDMDQFTLTRNMTLVGNKCYLQRVYQQTWYREDQEDIIYRILRQQ